MSWLDYLLGFVSGAIFALLALLYIYGRGPKGPIKPA